jgi:hypothetical protein
LIEAQVATSAGMHELKTPLERSDEETEAMPAKSVHRSGNQLVTIVTLLKRTRRTLPGIS